MASRSIPENICRMTVTVLLHGFLFGSAAQGNGAAGDSLPSAGDSIPPAGDDEMSLSDLVDSKTRFPDGIRVYDSFNVRIGGDSMRYCNGQPCSGWVQDYHANGKLKHKGYYEGGQLMNLYFNYYESGQLEREFKAQDDFRCRLTSYYSNGVMRSKVSYKDGAPLEWEDYYPNGQVEFQEVYHKSFEYHIINKYYYENGQAQTEMVLLDKKKKVFDKREYFVDGTVKNEGQVRYNPGLFDYIKIGTWKEYDESGKLLAEQIYDNNGQLNREVRH